MSTIDKTLNARLHDDFWVQYQTRTNLVKSIKEDEKFYAGDQWNGKNDSNMPRANLNIVAKGINLIASKLNGTPLYLSYAATDENVDCSKLRTFDESVCKMKNLDTFSYCAYVNGENTGTEITYVIWDDSSEDVGGFYSGGLAFEHISPLSIAVANPHQTDIQKQEWVMIWTDVSVRQLKLMLEEEDWSTSKFNNKTQALNDEAKRSLNKRLDETNESKDIINQTLLRVYLRFFRINGEVVYTCETDTVSIFKYPHPLSTAVRDNFAEETQKAYEKAVKDGQYKDGFDSFVRDYDMDFEDTIVNMARKPNSLEKHRKLKRKFYLYPFAVFKPVPINNSFFGASKTKQMIPIQKAINHETSMVIKAAENNAYNKIFAKEGAIRQQITNEPGQIIVDHSRNPNSWGIKMAESQPMPNDVATHTSFMINQAKEIYGFNDTLQGNITNQDASGYMLQQAIKEANTPLEQEQKLAWKYQKDLAKIRIMFYEHYLSEAYYTYEYTEGEYSEQEESRKAMLQAAMNPQYGQEGFGLNVYMPDGKTLIPAQELKERFSKPTSRISVNKFNAKTLWGVDFEIVIDAQQGLSDSKLSEAQSWDNMILNGGISKLTADQLQLYVKGNPSFSPAFKSEIGRYLKQLEKSQIQQLQMQLQQASQTIQQMQIQMQQQGMAYQEMQKNFKQSMDNANRVNRLAIADNDKLRGQLSQGSPIAQNEVTEGEVKSNSARGISSSMTTPMQN